MHAFRAAALASCLTTAGGCSSNRTVTVAAVPTPSGAPASAGGSAAATTTSTRGWRVESREHVDLWLHGFALLQEDSSLVPSFRPGYGASMRGVRPSGAGQLDANRLRLQRRFGENPNLVSAQFLCLYFATWDDLRRGVERFRQAGGDVRAANDQEELRMFATIRTYFPTADDRDWLQVFVSSMEDERARFYRAYWFQQEQLGASMRRQVESLWNSTYRGAFTRFLGNTNQREGTIVLSLPLGGEGRTLSVGPRNNFVSVGFPLPTEDPREAIAAIAHEIVGRVATATVRDNTTEAERRAGEDVRWSTLAAVRGGRLLLERVAPDLVDVYQRYYLRLARVTPSGRDVSDTFFATFPLPPTIATALQRQIDLVLSGI